MAPFSNNIKTCPISPINKSINHPLFIVGTSQMQLKVQSDL
jgi:hypothetical protein